MIRRLKKAIRRRFHRVVEKAPHEVVHTPEALERYLTMNKPPFAEWVGMFGEGVYRARNEAMATIAAKMQPRCVVEAGAAGPFLANAMLERCPTIERYICVNFHPRMADYIRERLTHAVAEVREVDIHQLDADALAEYDLFVSTSLEHFREDRAVLERLKPGTRVLASISTFNGPEHWRVLLSARDVKKRYGHLLELRVVKIAGSAGRKLLMTGVRR